MIPWMQEISKIGAKLLKFSNDINVVFFLLFYHMWVMMNYKLMKRKSDMVTVFLAYAPFIEIALGAMTVCAVYEFFFMGNR